MLYRTNVDSQYAGANRKILREKKGGKMAKIWKKNGEKLESFRDLGKFLEKNGQENFLR